MNPFYPVSTLAQMQELYLIPPGPKRFAAYLTLLQGETKGDLVYPIANYNPMAKPLIAEKVGALVKLGAEDVLLETLKDINNKTSSYELPEVGVALNLADDLLGGWTNRYTTDYDTKFKIQALAKRHFCVAILWSSEEITEQLIEKRIRAACYRMVYYQLNGRPLNLQQHVDQELFAAEGAGDELFLRMISHSSRRDFLSKQGLSEDYQLIFNFLYGNEASESLGFPGFGLPDFD